MSKDASPAPEQKGPIFATVDLEEPLTRGEQKISKLTLRKPHGGEMRGLSMVDLIKLEVDAIRQLLPRISDPILTVADADNLGAEDLFQISTEIAGFFLPKGMRPDSLAQ